MTRDLTLPARMDYASLDAFHAEIKEARGEDLNLDGSKVTHLGACGLQLLVSAWKAWERDGHSLIVTHPSEKFCDHIQQLGLSSDMFGHSGVEA